MESALLLTGEQALVAKTWNGKPLAIVIAVIAAIAGVLVAPASPAFAAGCRSAPFSASLYGADPLMRLDHVVTIAYPSPTGSYVSTSQCPRNISVKNTGTGDRYGAPFYACINYVSGGGCTWTKVNPGQWAYIATGVPYGTRFRIQILWDPGMYYSFKAVGDF